MTVYEHEYTDVKGRTITMEIEYDGLRYIARRFVNCNEANICIRSTEESAHEEIKNFEKMSPPAA
jgi:hypothetical protein